jgi:hypothetical protein
LSALAEALYRFDPPWLEVGRIYRRICFLRSEGLREEAQRIEDGEFAEAAARARDACASREEAEAHLRALKSEEKERVAGAVAFAEVLVPMLASKLPQAAAAHGHAPAPERRKPRAASGEARGIADFIDDMLDQDRSSQR